MSSLYFSRQQTCPRSRCALIVLACWLAPCILRALRFSTSSIFFNELFSTKSLPPLLRYQRTKVQERSSCPWYRPEGRRACHVLQLFYHSEQSERDSCRSEVS